MSTPDYLYDDDPQPLHAGPGRPRRGLLLALGAGTVAVAVAAVVALPLLTGSAEEQVTEVADVFTRALAAGDAETAWGLLCEDEQNRVQVDQVAADYLRPGTPSVGDPAEGERDGQRAEVVPVTWSAGGATVTVELTVIAEDGAKVCGIS
ncbi:hypothetical protein SAMN05660199_02274 [Klenkia soli]|uniref:DUF4878 domain-containing protein n=1 Tax=Klenkia soli TaxID=1052260 RepID=A0A1H0KYH0_9ACTN|nr:hypothetical protein [Klenkia soli]SDO60770.1 hypothetical protein SAMN05660199_02274 [Klenkia soli]